MPRFPTQNKWTVTLIRLMKSPYRDLTHLLHATPTLVGISLMILTACKHYKLEIPRDHSTYNLAIGSVINQTNEPRLSMDLRNKLSERLMQSSHLRHVGQDEANFILETNISSYQVEPIGEVKIDSNDSDQRKFRTSIFRVQIQVEYTMTSVEDSSQSTATQRVIGTSEFNELVDIDGVRKDGLRAALYDACHNIVVSLEENVLFKK